MYIINLINVTIPDSVIVIRENVFSDNDIANITIEGDSTRFNDIWITIGFLESLKPKD